jgi:hypothetical protein
METWRDNKTKHEKQPNRNYCFHKAEQKQTMISGNNKELQILVNKCKFLDKNKFDTNIVAPLKSFSISV